MMSRRKFLVCAGSAALVFPALGARSATAPVAVGLLADAQYADQDAKRTRFYRNSLEKLNAAIRYFDGVPLEFCVNLGDLIDRDWQNFGPALATLRRSKHRFYSVLGNHDFEVDDPARRKVPRRLGLSSRYYAVNRGKFSFVFLDTNEISVYAHPAGTPERAAAEVELRDLQARKAIQAQTWNGGVSAKQLAWFERVCASAARRGRKVVVFAHHPVFPRNEHNVWDDGRVLESIARHRNVVAWINGHNHAGLYGEHAGVAFLTLRGMVETPDQNAFAVARFFPDHLELTGFGREPAREFRFTDGNGR